MLLTRFAAVFKLVFSGPLYWELENHKLSKFWSLVFGGVFQRLLSDSVISESSVTIVSVFNTRLMLPVLHLDFTLQSYSMLHHMTTKKSHSKERRWDESLEVQL